MGYRRRILLSYNLGAIDRGVIGAYNLGAIGGL